MTDAEGYSTTFIYDAMDRVVTITDAKGGVTRYTYTDRGEVATKTDAEGYATSYEYDGNGNCVKMSTILWTASLRPPRLMARARP